MSNILGAFCPGKVLGAFCPGITALLNDLSGRQPGFSFFLLDHQAIRQPDAFLPDGENPKNKPVLVYEIHTSERTMI
jgi:hypothetical protein